MRSKNFKDNNSGLTLLELIIGLAISLIVIVAAFSFVNVGISSYDNTNKTTTLQQEVSFINNILGNGIRSGSKDQVTIVKYATGDKALYTGTKVFYYNANKESLYIYEGSEWKTAAITSNNNDNLVSKYVKSFDVNYEKTDTTTTTPTTYINGDEYTGCSNLLNVHMKVQVKNKKDESQIIYNIRNNS